MVLLKISATEKKEERQRWDIEPRVLIAAKEAK